MSVIKYEVPKQELHVALDAEISAMMLERARQQEIFIRRALMKLKTHRMNVVLHVEGSPQVVKLPGTDRWHYQEPPMWLELKLPRGPRPLP